jgi:hypothetical protein
MRDGSPATSRLQALRQRLDDFRAAGRANPRLGCLLALPSTTTGAPPLLHGELGAWNSIRLNGHPDTLPIVGRATVESGWRVAIRRLGPGPHPGPPPQSFVDNKPVNHSDAPFPKPWGFFHPDSPNVEVAQMHYAGDAPALAAFRQLARMTLRTLREAGMPERMQPLTVRASRMLRVDDSADFWTILLFAAAWEGIAPRSISAERHTWWGPLPLPFDSAEREATLAALQSPGHPVAQLFARHPRPESWEHFYSELDPDLNTASGELLADIIRALEARPSASPIALPSRTIGVPNPAAGARAPHVFLCHATEDKARFVEPLARALHANGVQAFYDEWDIRLGDSLWQRISDGIDRADTFIFVASPISLQKNWVRMELGGAIAAKMGADKPLILIVLDGCADRLPTLLKSLRYLEVHDTTDFGAELRTLLDEIHGHNPRPTLGPSRSVVGSSVA